VIFQPIFLLNQKTDGFNQQMYSQFGSADMLHRKPPALAGGEPKHADISKPSHLTLFREIRGFMKEK